MGQAVMCSENKSRVFTMEVGDDDDENEYYPVGKFNDSFSSDDETSQNLRNTRFRKGKRKEMFSVGESLDVSDSDASGAHNRPWFQRTTNSSNDDSSDEDDGGELIMKKKKIRNEARRDDNLYGVFNTDDTFYTRKSSSLRNQGEKANVRPVHFVPSSTTTETISEEKHVNTKSSSSAMENANARFYALLSRDWGNSQQEKSQRDDAPANIGTSTENTSTTTDFVEAQQDEFNGLGFMQSMSKPPKPKNDRDFGKWEKHTKGIGSKLLAKMGYQGSGGLGSKRRRASNDELKSTVTGGVSRPVEVVVRPTYLGLGYGNFQEATSLKVNRQIEAELQGKNYDDNNDGKESIQKKDFFRVTALNKKRFHKWTSTMISSGNRQWEHEKHKRKRATPEEATAAKIIDMRGPASTGLPPKLGEELLYNVNLLMQSIETKANVCNEALSYAKRKLQTVHLEIESLNDSLQSTSQKCQRLQDITSSIQDIKEKIKGYCSGKDDDDVRTVHNIQDMFSKFKSIFSQDYEALQLEQILIQLIAPWIEYSLMKIWVDPMKRPHQVALFVEQWQKILGCEKNSVSILLLVSRYLIPKIQTAFGRPWDVVESYQSALTLYESCRTTFVAVACAIDEDEDIHQELGLYANVQNSLTSVLDDIIVPKLCRAVTSSWRPPSLQNSGKESLSSAIPIHEWLLPWMRYLNDENSTKPTLIKEVFRKFRNLFLKINNANNSMAEWNSFNQASLQMLLPWKGVVDDAVMESLIREAIVPQLALLLATKLVVQPINQDFSPIQMVLSWHDVGLLRTFHLTCLLEGLIFLPWANVLHLWLSSGATKMEEVSQFYWSWRCLIPFSVVRDPVICRYLFCGLSMIEASLKKDALALNKLKPPSGSSNIDTLTFYAKVVSRRVSEERHLAEEKERHTMEQTKMMYAAEVMPEYIYEKTSFREVVQDFAQQHDLLFQPKASGANTSTKDGKQIFYFGVVPVYFDSDVAFAWIEDLNQWKAKSLEQLLELNKK
jgi:tuftelin-interacting protein 11